MSYPWPYRRIAAEEAFCVPEVYEALRGQDAAGLRRIRRQLLDLDGERLEIMDANGVDVQVLSLTAPGVQTFGPAQGTALARLANDRLAELIGKRPGRFAGLAAIAPQDPAAAAAEIDRAVTELKLNGVIINSRTGREYLDEERYWPLLEVAEAHGVPLCIHPRAETGLDALRLIGGGVFDRFPRLRVVLGQLGEGLPYWLYRLDYTHPVRASYEPRPALSLTPSEYVKRNFAITTSGMNWAPVLRFGIEAVGADNIMFAIDYPYRSTEAAVRFLDEAEISDEDRRKIYHRNAERIFGIPDCGES
jgi:5-carboxyvanillate decarboxylase